MQHVFHHVQAEFERERESERKLKKMRERLLKEEVEILRGNREDLVDDGALVSTSGIVFRVRCVQLQ
jgi:RNA binding exosome subunit